MKEIVLVLPDIRSVYNVGSIIRTAAFFGVRKIIYTGYTPYPGDARRSLARPGLKLEKVSLGAEKMVENIYQENLDDVIFELKNEGYKIVALELAENAVEVTKFVWPEKCVLIVGNELVGLDKNILATCDAVVQILGTGPKECLNVASATAIALSYWTK